MIVALGNWENSAKNIYCRGVFKLAGSHGYRMSIDLPFYIYLLSFSKFELNHDAICLLVILCVAVLKLV